MAKIEKADEKLVAVRLSADEIEAIDAAVRSGVVANSSDAIRVALRYLPYAITAKFLEEDMPKLTATAEALRALRNAALNPARARGSKPKS